MKSLQRILGLIFIALALVFFLYGSVKTQKAETKGDFIIELEPGITMVDKNQQDDLAKKGFLWAAVFGISGVALLLISRKAPK